MSSHGQELLGRLIRATINATEIFENHRPEWLNGLELDFWVPEWNLAFEFQGDQHSTPVFGVQAMAAQQIRDKLKRQICERLHIMLITFEAASLDPYKMRTKLFYHVARVHPDMKKGERKRLVRRMMIPKWENKKERKSIIRSKSKYCHTLKSSFDSPTAWRKGSKGRREAIRDKFSNVDWREVYAARRAAYEYYMPPEPTPPRYGMGMAKAAKMHG